MSGDTPPGSGTALAWGEAQDECYGGWVTGMPGITQRLDRLEGGQTETNRHLVRIDRHLESIDQTLHTASKLFELMNSRLENLETGQERVVEHLDRLEVGQERVVDRLDRLEVGQERVVDRLERLEVGQGRVVDRLDRLIDATIRERTVSGERLARVEERLDVVERRLDDSPKT
jgi:chromosome segregation ATPase